MSEFITFITNLGGLTHEYYSKVQHNASSYLVILGVTSDGGRGPVYSWLCTQGTPGGL